MTKDRNLQPGTIPHDSKESSFCRCRTFSVGPYLYNIYADDDGDLKKARPILYIEKKHGRIVQLKSKIKNLHLNYIFLFEKFSSDFHFIKTKKNIYISENHISRKIIKRNLVLLNEKFSVMTFYYMQNQIVVYIIFF